MTAKQTDTTADDEPVVEIPHDPFNEQVIIAAAIADEKIRKDLTQRLKADLFKGDGHAPIWKTLRELERKGLEYSAAAMRQLGGEDVDEDYLDELAEAYPETPPNIRHHVDTLQWDNARMNAVDGPLKSLLLELQNPTAEPTRVHALARQLPLAFDGYGSRQFMHDPNQLVRDMMAGIKDRRDRQACYPYGLEGFDQYDDGTWRVIPGAAPGLVTVVTAVPGSFKSTVTAIIALEQARMKRKVLYGAWEMQSPVTLELLTIMSLGWSRYKVSVGGLNDKQLRKFEARALRISQYVKFWKLPFGREPGKRWTNDHALDDIHGYIADSGCEFAVFDLWKRCLVDTRPDQEEQALIRMQMILDETQVHGVLCQQQRHKDIELRQNKKPTREGIKGSGAWTEVADTIIGVYNPALFMSVPADTLELILLKQRFAQWPLSVEMDLDADKAHLSNGRSVDYNTPPDGDGTIGGFMKQTKVSRKRKDEK